MRPAWKTACLLFLFMLISPLYAEPFPEPQPSPKGEGSPLEPQPSLEGEGSPLEPQPSPKGEGSPLEPQPSPKGEGSPLEPQPSMEGEGSPLEPQPNLNGESSPPNDEFFFLEELFISGEAFSFEPQPNLEGEGSPLAEFLTGEKTPPDEDILLSEEILSVPQPNLKGEDSPPNEEQFLSEKIFSNEESRSGEGTLLGEKNFLDEETLLAEDNDAFFFEAPPLILEVPKFEIRSLDAIFPDFSQRQRITARSKEGLRSSFVKGESPTLVPNPNLGINLLGSVMKKNPSHLIEALVVVPYNEKELDLLDIYNALGRIEKIKDHPVSVNGNDFYVFTESTRIESAHNRKAISDPFPAVTLPFSQTIYLRLKEINFGNLFIRADVSISMYGITYSMTNFTDVRYFLIPLMKAERFITIIYLEPVKEGILIYSMSGFYLPGFIANRVNLTANINRRIEIFINWITEGLRKQESAAAE